MPGVTQSSKKQVEGDLEERGSCFVQEHGPPFDPEGYNTVLCLVFTYAFVSTLPSA